MMLIISGLSPLKCKLKTIVENVDIIYKHIKMIPFSFKWQVPIIESKMTYDEQKGQAPETLAPTNALPFRK